MMVDDTKARIRAVAIELFSTLGYEQTSLREIAERVGMTKASLYYHYPSKQALLAALIQPLIEDLRGALPGVAAEPHTPETVRAALGTFLEIMLRHRTAWALCSRDTPAVLAALEDSREDLLEVGNRIRAWLAGPAPGDADRVRALAATEVIASAVSSAALLPDVPEEVVRRTLLDSAVAVLAPAGSAAVPATPVGPVAVPAPAGGAAATAGTARGPAGRGARSGDPHPGRR